MHDADGISSHYRVKNSTLLRSRVEFLIKCFCFFTAYLIGIISSCPDRFSSLFVGYPTFIIEPSFFYAFCVGA